MDRHRLYLSPPLVDGRPVGELSPDAAEALAGAAVLAGTYAITWS